MHIAQCTVCIHDRTSLVLLLFVPVWLFAALVVFCFFSFRLLLSFFVSFFFFSFSSVIVFHLCKQKDMQTHRCILYWIKRWKTATKRHDISMEYAYIDNCTIFRLLHNSLLLDWMVSIFFFSLLLLFWICDFYSSCLWVSVFKLSINAYGITYRTIASSKPFSHICFQFEDRVTPLWWG